MNITEKNGGVQVSGIELFSAMQTFDCGQCFRFEVEGNKAVGNAFGKTVEISVNNAVCVYSGLGDIKVSQGDRVEKGDVIGSVGTVPFEADSEHHIHAAVKVNGSYADPLNFIGNEE